MLRNLFLSTKKSHFCILTLRFSSMSHPIVPINDLNEKSIKNYDHTEKDLRCKLASVYRLVYLNGWTSGIYNHITARLTNESNNFLINPFGLLYSEITASSLVRIDESCNILDNGSTNFGVNKAGFTLHSAIHQARNDINFIIHVHSKHAAAISALNCGLLPISQEAMICGEISYHDYGGIVIDDEMKAKIAKDLGPKNFIMILRNHGVVVCGRTIEETWHYMYNFMYACEIQLNALSANQKLNYPSQKAIDQVKEVTSKGGGGVNVVKHEIKWGLGELEFQAEMRILDSMGYQTGCTFKSIKTS